MAVKASTSVFTFGDDDATLVTAVSGAQIRLGNGNDVVTSLGNTATISAGNGNNVVTACGTGNTITAGTGNNTITTGARSSVVTGSGDQTVTAMGDQTTVRIGGNAGGDGHGSSIVALGAGNSITAGDGAVSVFLFKGGNSVTVGDGSNTIMAGNPFGLQRAANGGNTLHLGNGSNGVFLGGSGNVVYDGTGTDTIMGSTMGGDRFVLNASGGTESIYNFTLQNRDVLDLSRILQGTGADLAHLASYVSIAQQADAMDPAATDSVLTIHGATATATVTLNAIGAVSVNDLVSHHSVIV